MKREKLYNINGKEKTESQLTEDEKKEIKEKQLKHIDEVFDEEDKWITRRSIVEEVLKNMNKTINLENDSEVKKFVEDFQKLPWEKRILYGIWHSSTPEAIVQKLLKEGKTFEEARKEVGL